MQTKTTNRDLSIDLLKVLCTLWIVGFWHLSNYGDVIAPKAWEHNSDITTAALGVFMYFSGYFLSKYKINNSKDILNFYTIRLKRFYGLYLTSVFMLWLGGLFTPKPWFKSDFQILTTILGISSFFKPDVGTLWFLSMLMFFYWLTPIVKRMEGFWNQVFAISIVWIVIYALDFFFHSINVRIFSFLPMYFIGAFTNHAFYQKMIKTHWSWCAIILFLFCCYIPRNEIWIIGVIKDVLLSTTAVIGGGAFCSFVMKYVKNDIIINILTWLSYCSLAVYLFHREVYQLLVMVFGKLHIDISILILYFVFFPSAFIFAYLMQKCYDCIIRKLSWGANYKKS